MGYTAACAVLPGVRLSFRLCVTRVSVPYLLLKRSQHQMYRPAFRDVFSVRFFLLFLRVKLPSKPRRWEKFSSEEFRR